MLWKTGLRTSCRNSLLSVTAVWLVSACSGPSQEELANRPTERVSVEDIYVAYRDNEVAAQQRFDRANLAVTGTIASIELMPNGDPGLFLTAPRGRIASVELDESATDAVAKMRAGQEVTVLCRSVDMIGVSDPVYDLNDCRIGS